MKTKNFIMMVVLALFFIMPVQAENDIYTENVTFSAYTITGSGNITSNAIQLKSFKPNGFFSVQLTSAGASSQITIEYLLSIDGTNYLDCGTDIKTGHTPGTMLYAFPSGEPMVAKYMKIKLTETAGSNVTSFSVKLCIQ